MSHTPPNIIVIVLDALRARNLGCYGMPGDISPHMDAVARESLLFENVYAAWNTTDQSLTSIMTGKYPRSNGLMNHGDKAGAEERKQFAQTGTSLLAEILHDSGYQTIAVDWMGRWHKRGYDDYGYKIDRKGWQKVKHNVIDLPRLYTSYLASHLPILKLYAPVRKPTLKDMISGLKDVFSTFSFTHHLAQMQDAAYITDVALDRLQHRNDQPFYLFLHYWDIHTPYHCPRSYINTENVTDNKSLLTEKYYGAISYVDDQLQRLFDYMQTRELWDNTLLVITSDHGDSLTEHDIFFDHHGLYEETTHVPLLLHYPDLFKTAQRVPGFVQHIDLVPTICELIGQPERAESMDGSSLLPLIQDGTPLRDHVFIEESYVQKKAALRTERYKFIKAKDSGWCNYCQKIHVGEEELYDLHQDPHELHDILDAQPQVADDMRQRLTQKMQKLDRKRQSAIEEHGDETPTDEDDDEELLKKQFKNLGYMT